jgi:tol-pal system protein YbgF
MVGQGKPPTMLQPISRSTLAFVLLFACLMSTQAAHAQDSPSDVVTRLDQLEETVRDLTGQVQELQYRNQQLEQEVQRLQGSGAAPPIAAGPPSSAAPSPPGAPLPRASVSTSLPPPTATPYSTPPQYSQGPPPAQYGQPPQYGAPPQYAPPPVPVVAGAPSSGHDAFNPALDPNAPGVPHALGTSTTATEPPPPVSDASVAAPRQAGAPLDLSTGSAPSADAASGGAASPAAAPAGGLPPPPPANPSGTGAQQAALPPSNTPKDDYDLAYGYVLQKQYGPAANAFRDFLQKYPSDRLAAEAQYWLGESLYQGQQYHDAAEAFLAVSTKYETAARAPDALLGLGQSLAALGEKEAACASLGEVLRKYPKASPNLKQTVDREQKRVHC